MSIDRIGQQFGNYRLTRLLGEGGFAEVYLGEHIHLSSQVAIKLLHTKLVSREQEEFLAEARTIAALDHLSIVRVIDCGIEHGEPFLVMNYAPNGTVRQRYPKSTRMPSNMILEYVLQVADALQYAHDRKLIHRDVKPENMLLDNNDRLLLSDFGIALISSSSTSQSTKAATGTVSYMAPEQVLGKPRIASDQYGLGIVIYEWLCGELPFRGSFSEVCAQHLYASPPSLVGKVSMISPATEAVVMKALAKEPSERFATIQDFANALQGSYEQTSPVLSVIKTVSVSSKEAVQASSLLEATALPVTISRATPLPVASGTLLAQAASPGSANSGAVVAATVLTQLDSSVARSGAVSIDESKVILHGVGRSQANERTDGSGKNASKTQPIPLVSALASMVPAGRPRRSLFIVVGALLVLLLMALPVLAHSSLLFPTSSQQNPHQSVAQLDKTPSPNQPTQPVNSGQPSPTPTSTSASTSTPQQQQQAQQPQLQPQQQAQQQSQQQPQPQSQQPVSQPTLTPIPQPTSTPLPTTRTLGPTTVALGLNVNATGHQNATYATGHIYLENTVSTCFNSNSSLYDPPHNVYITTLQPVCFDQLNVYYDVQAMATNAGSASNYPVGMTFSCGSCDGYIYSGFNNGQDAYSYVLQSDIDNAVTQLENATTTQAQNDLASQMGSNEHMVGSPQCTSAWQSDHSAGDQVATFNVTVTTRCAVTVST